VLRTKTWNCQSVFAVSGIKMTRCSPQGKQNATTLVATGVSVYQQLVDIVLETLRYSRKKVQLQASPSSTGIATTAFLKPCDR